MTTIDPLARATSCRCTSQGAPPEKSKSRAKVFGQILRAAGAVASATLPGVGPAIGAVADAIDRSRRGALAGFDGTSDALRYLELQRAIQEETRTFETLSNVMKARHDATMNSIRNMRS